MHLAVSCILLSQYHTAFPSKAAVLPHHPVTNTTVHSEVVTHVDTNLWTHTLSAFNVIQTTNKLQGSQTSKLADWAYMVHIGVSKYCNMTAQSKGGLGGCAVHVVLHSPSVVNQDPMWASADQSSMTCQTVDCHCLLLEDDKLQGADCSMLHVLTTDKCCSGFTSLDICIVVSAERYGCRLSNAAASAAAARYQETQLQVAPD